LKCPTRFESAEVDIIAVTQWYAEQGGQALAGRFFDAAREAAETIKGMPGLGSPRLGQLIGIEGLRSWPLRRFPVRWFYIDGQTSSTLFASSESAKTSRRSSQRRSP
jgi:plasmid stabilization system protein ParE